MNLKPFCSLYSLCSWSSRHGLLLFSPPNVEPKLTICPHLHGVQLCPIYLQTFRLVGHLLLFWSSWFLLVAPEMSNDLYKHHATDPIKETTNTKIGEIKIVFFLATHLFGKNAVEAFNACFSWHLLPLHPSFILHPFTPFLVYAFRNGSRWSQAVEDDAWSTQVPWWCPSPASLDVSEPGDVPSMTLGFSGSERKSAVAIWCNVHPARAATWHIWHVSFPTLAFSLSSPMGLCRDVVQMIPAAIGWTTPRAAGNSSPNPTSQPTSLHQSIATILKSWNHEFHVKPCRHVGDVTLRLCSNNQGDVYHSSCSRVFHLSLKLQGVHLGISAPGILASASPSSSAMYFNSSGLKGTSICEKSLGHTGPVDGPLLSILQVTLGNTTIQDEVSLSVSSTMTQEMYAFENFYRNHKQSNNSLMFIKCE